MIIGPEILNQGQDKRTASCGVHYPPYQAETEELWGTEG